MNVLFVSGLDFKEKSIQVIRKTPEYYAKKNCIVDYVVARDNLNNGNYFYEEEINPEGVNVHRVYWPFPGMRANLSRFLSLALTKVSACLVVIKLFLLAKKLLRKNDYDVIYGYEIHGVLAVYLLKKCGLVGGSKIVSRFQGSFLNEMIEKRQFARIVFNIDAILAMKADCDLMVLTDDGTKADEALRKINAKTSYIFVPNGVDIPPANILAKKTRIDAFNNARITCISVSRLVGWKRVDRCLNVFKELCAHNGIEAEYLILGDGEEREHLESVARRLGIDHLVKFLGAVNQSEVFKYIADSDVFLSMYDHSNVANPLFEAMRLNKLIVTINNGSTGLWIKHMDNGLIYNEGFIDAKKISDDIVFLVSNEPELSSLLSNLSKTADEKLWTWDQRLQYEYQAVSALISGR